MSEQLQSKCHLFGIKVQNVAIAKVAARLEVVFIMSLALNAQRNAIRNVKIADHAGVII